MVVITPLVQNEITGLCEAIQGHTSSASKHQNLSWQRYFISDRKEGRDWQHSLFH